MYSIYVRAMWSVCKHDDVRGIIPSYKPHRVWLGKTYLSPVWFSSTLVPHPEPSDRCGRALARGRGGAGERAHAGRARGGVGGPAAAARGGGRRPTPADGQPAGGAAPCGAAQPLHGAPVPGEPGG